MQLAGSNSIFSIEEADATLIQRIQDKDLSPASPLPGKGKDMANNQALQLIQEACEDWQAWITSLENMGMEEAWRANILHITEPDLRMLDDTSVELTFQLPPGCYATSVLRELVSCHGE